MSEKRELLPLALRIPPLLLCGLGLGVSIELANIHVKVHTTPGFQSFCSVSQAINCDTVAQSPYSVFLGLPVAIWGILGYLMMALPAVVLMRRRPRGGASPAVGGLLLLSGGSVLASVALGTVSVMCISALCPLCLITYGVNLSLLALAFVMARSLGGVVQVVRDLLAYTGSHRPTMAGLVGLAVLVVASLALGMPAYWSEGEGGERRADGLAMGVTDGGAHWIGAARPKVRIVEFSDYQCPFCSRAHKEARKLLSEHPEEIQLIHRHYPLDQHCNPAITRPFHEQACELSLMAICAGEQGRFWEANDVLYERGRQGNLSAGDLAKEAGLDPGQLEGCLREGATMEKLMVDIKAGNTMSLRGTPTFVIDGKTHMGRIPQDEINRRLSAP